MKAFFQDLIAHTHTVGILPILKLTATDENIVIDSLSVEREVKMDAVTYFPEPGLRGVFGMTNLNKLDLHLKCPEYVENSIITVQYHDESTEDEPMPSGLHFKNAAGDFENDYKFINKNIINDQVKKLKVLSVIDYHIEFEPSESSIQRLKLQSAVHTEETVFSAITIGNNLVFRFGSEDTHAGSFIFQPNVNYKLSNPISWPIQAALNILNLKGEKIMSISDTTGVLKFEVRSGIASYTYLLPAYTK